MNLIILLLNKIIMSIINYLSGNLDDKIKLLQKYN
jgi:hypothetical protein